MNTLSLFFSLIWFTVIFKNILFFVYLWQLKNYHWGRFISHFQTINGKKILKDKVRIFKVVILILYLFNPFFIYGYLFIILIEAMNFFRKFMAKKLIKPVLTKKASILISASAFLYLILFFAFPYNPLFSIVAISIDAFSLIVVSLVVLALEPISILARKRTIASATKKISSFENLKKIGITGSFGKSTTKEILSFLLEDKFNVLKTEKNLNSEMGVSQTILKDLKEDYNVFICEMGAYNVGGIKLLADIVKPSIGILTGINSQHLATFGSQENIIKAKYELIESLPKDGLAIFNGDNSYCLKLYNSTDKRKMMFSIDRKNNSDIWAEDIKVNKENLEFKVFYQEDSFNLKVNLIGKELLGNVLSSIIVARELGMTPGEISERLEKFNNLGIKIIKNSRGVSVLNSTYSSNPDGMIAHLNHLNKWDGKKAVIFKPLIELGKSAKEVHISLAKKMSENCDLVIVTSEEFFNEMKDVITDTKFIFSNNIDTIEELVSDFKEGDVILLENRIDEKIIDKIND